MAQSTTNQAHRVESDEEEAPRRWEPHPTDLDDHSIVMSDEEENSLNRSAIVISDDDEADVYISEDDEGYGVASSVVQNLTHVLPHVSGNSTSSSSVEGDESPGRVEIIGGTYNGSRGIFVRQTDCQVVVQLEDASERRLARHNVRFLDPSTPSARPRRSSPEALASPMAVAETMYFPGDTVRIVGGSYRGKTATVVQQKPKTVAVRIENDDTIRNLRLSSVAPAIDGDPLLTSAAQSTASPGVPNTRLRRSPRGHPSSSRGDVSPEETPPLELLHHVLGLREDSVTLVAPGKFAQCQKTLAFVIFGHRVRTLQFSSFSSSLAESLPIISIEPDGSKYELLSVKLQKPNSFESKRCGQIQAQYVMTKAPRHLRDSIPTINMQEQLERFANFGTLTTGKVVARLELLQSTAYMYKQRPVICTDLTVDDFEEIPEEAHEGCGFMPAALVQRLFGTRAVGKRTFALQVRILAPKLGLFKGMLVVKPGIQRIQLPSSMRKVDASAEENADCVDTNKVIFLVNGKFPSDVNAVHLPKLFRGELPAESFEPKVLNNMIIRLWQEWPIPDEVIDRYVKESRKAQGVGLEHTCLVGLADPTDGIPAGMVFITGIHCQQAPIQDAVFVTRYPCTESVTDGHILPVLRDRPSSMDEATWKWINTLPFGGILFGNPASPSQEPLPCQIANGDLDGDLYFVCWNEEVVSLCRAVRSVGVAPTTRTNVTAGASPVVNPDWLRQGQVCMSDVQSLARLSKLISQLHKHWKLKTSAGEYVHYGRAYKKALDIGKHGGFVSLPHHLWESLPSSLHSFLTAYSQ
jgi:RNA dependent RNA polymerase/KOW motif